MKTFIFPLALLSVTAFLSSEGHSAAITNTVDYFCPSAKEANELLRTLDQKTESKEEAHLPWDPSRRKDLIKGIFEQENAELYVLDLPKIFDENKNSIPENYIQENSEVILEISKNTTKHLDSHHTYQSPSLSSYVYWSLNVFKPYPLQPNPHLHTEKFSCTYNTFDDKKYTLFVYPTEEHHSCQIKQASGISDPTIKKKTCTNEEKCTVICYDTQ